MEIVFQETWEGSDGQDWPTGWLLIEGAGETSRSIQSNTGQQVAEDAFAYRYDIVTADEYHNFDITIDVDFRDITSPGNNSGFIARWVEPNGYYIEIDAKEGGEGSIAIYSAEAYSLVAQGTQTLSFLSFTIYTIRIQMIDNDIKIKVWEASQSEPASWYLETTDTDWSNGSFGLSCYSTDGSQTVRWDNLTIQAEETGSVIQPDVDIEFFYEVEYDETSVAAPQPEAEIDFIFETDYTPPPSTGGQPDLIVTFLMDVEYEPEPLTTDLVGEGEIFFTTKGDLDIDYVPVPIPVVIDMEDVLIVSITMPVPQEFDRYGRPIG